MDCKGCGKSLDKEALYGVGSWESVDISGTAAAPMFVLKPKVVFCLPCYEVHRPEKKKSK